MRWLGLKRRITTACTRRPISVTLMYAARGAVDLLEEIEGRVDGLFRGFIAEEREGENG